MDYATVVDDATRLFGEYFGCGDTLTINQSSDNHFHAIFTSKRIMGLDECLRIGYQSASSKEYLRRCAEIGYFAVRTTGKSDGTGAPRNRLRLEWLSR